MSTPLPPVAPGCLHVASLGQARAHKRRYGAVLTLQDPRCRRNDKLAFHSSPKPAHMVLEFEDVDRDDLGVRVATREQVSAALQWLEQYRVQATLVHCRVGRGRSAAVALAGLYQRCGSAEQALAELLAQRPEATPNYVVLRHADALLSTGGALEAAVQASENARRAPLAVRELRERHLLRFPQLYARW